MSSREWRAVEIGEICSVKGGKRLPKGKDLIKDKNTHPYIRIRDMYQVKNLELNDEFEYVDDETFKKISKYIANTEDVILAIVGNTIGLVSKVGKTLDNASLTENCVKLIDLNGCISDFLYYHFTSQNGQNEIKKGIVGTSQPKLPIYNIQKISINLPPLPEQKAIAATLSCLDDKIELNNRMNKNLEEMAQAIFKSWFVDFEPFQEGEFEESDLGMIPKGWRVGTISDLASVTSGKRPSVKQDLISEGIRIPVVGASSIMAYTNEPLMSGKLLIIGRVGTHGIVQRFNKPCWPSDNTLVIKTDYYEFIYQILKSIDYKSMNRGSTQPLITQTDLKNIKVSIPKDNILERYEDTIKEIMEIWNNNKSENNILSQIRDTLLPKLMSGEVRVPYEEVI